MTESVKSLVVRLLDRFDQHISSQLLLLHYREDSNWWEPASGWIGGPRGFTGLHAASLGLVDITAVLLKMREWDVNAPDTMGCTAAAWVAGRGHERVSQILLELQDLTLGRAYTTYNKMPLLWASRNGQGGIAKMLLGREDVNLDTADSEYSQTSLVWATRYGRERVVKMLLGREDIRPNIVDTQYNRKPLWWAALNGYEGVLKILLEREEVNPNMADTERRRTPLALAALQDHAGIVKLLLEPQDVNPTQQISAVKHSIRSLPRIGVQKF